MGKFVVNGAIDATSHITIKNGADLYLQAPASAPNDSGDLIFTKYDGTEQGRIWISGGIGMIRFSSSDSSKTLIHSGNIGSQSVNYANSAGLVAWNNVSGKPSAFTPAAGSDNYIKVYNSSAVGDADGVTVDTLASQGFAVAMLNGATNNPTGKAKWIHCLNMPWGAGDNENWISQLAFGVENSDGIWYRTNAYTAVNKPWKRILDSSNYSSYALPITGGTLNGNLNVGGKVELWSDGEGGNIRLTSPNGSWWSIDALSNSALRFIWAESKVPFSFTSDGTISANYFTGTANYANTAGYATTADETNAGRGGGSIPWAGSFDSEPDVTAYRSMFSTYMDSSSTWWNLISNRHRNGSSDGVNYGMYIKCRLTGSWAHLLWNRQYGGSWQGERYIYDTGNVCISSSNPGNGNFYGQIWLKI